MSSIRLILTLILATTSISQILLADDGDSRGARINLQSVTRFLPNGGAALDFDVFHVLSGEAPSPLVPTGIGGAHIVDGTLSSEPGYDLAGGRYAELSYDGAASIGAGTLDCQQAEDRCRGCFSLTLSSQARQRSIENADTNNRAWKTTTKFSVLASSNNPAPRYSGPLQFTFVLNQKNTVELSSYVTFPKDVEYILRPANNQNGLSSNPESGTALTIDKDSGKLSWDLQAASGSGAQVGELYALQVIVRSTTATNDTNCKPEIGLDLMIQVGCPQELLEQGEPSCFLCSDINVAALVSVISEKAQTMLKEQIRRPRRKAFRAAERRGVEPTRVRARASRVRIRRAATFVKSLIERQAALLGIEDVQTECAAKSDIFCSSTSNAALKRPIEDVLATRGYAEEMLYRGFKRLYGTYLRRSKAVQRADKRREEFSKQLDTLQDLVDAIPDNDDTCGTLAL